MLEKLQNFYLTLQEPNKSCLLALRSIILAQDPAVSETIKYGMPCFTYGKKLFCYLWIDKKSTQPYLLLVEGKFLNHPKLEQGTRAKMKILRLNPKRNLPISTIHKILSEALNLYKSGKIKSK